MNLEVIRKNKVGMILQFSVPAIISMILTAMITLVDGFFAGNFIGKEGIAAINLGLPIVYLFLGMGLMISVGGIAIAGMAMGGGEHQKSRNVFNQTMFTTVVMSVAVAVAVVFFFELMLDVLRAEGVVRQYFKDYYLVMLIQLPISVINSSCGMFIRGEGNPQYFMGTSILNVLLNGVLDLVFVKYFDMGISGIAWASVAATLTTLLVNLFFFIKKAKVYRFGKFHFDGAVLGSTLFNGSSEFIGEMSMCISMFAYNLVIMRTVGVDGVTAFTIVGYLSFVFGMILIGFGQGSSVLMSFTYGAKEVELSEELRKKTSNFTFLAGAVFTAVMLLLAAPYCSIFVKEEAIQELAVRGIYLFVASFLVSGYNGIASVFFTSIGYAKESAVISAARGLVLLLICIAVLPLFLGMDGIWLAAPVTEGLTFLISLFYLNRFRKKEQLA